ncbi:MAG: hypothetical protein VX908_01305 [Planctomycetota bacterium]|nr:hypothetical protein [Planctomycetota bacterium]
MRTFIACMFLLLLPGCDSGAWDAKQLVSNMQKISLEESPSSIRIKSTNASVDLRVDRAAPTGSIEAEYWMEHDSMAEASDLLRASTLTPDMDDGRLYLEPHLQEGVSVHLEIILPDIEGVFIEIENGSVNVSGASGETDVKLGNGSVTVIDQQGTVTARLTNGSISVTNPTDVLELHTENGTITIEHAVSDIRARTANGSVTLDVQADMSPSLQVFATNGSIECQVGPAFTGEIDLVCENGSVQVTDQPGIVTAEVVDDDGNRHLVIGGGYNKSTLRSGNGSVEFTITSGPPPGDPDG